MSEKKKDGLYDAICEPLIQARIKNLQAAEIDPLNYKGHIDCLLYSLEQEIWQEVKQALNIEE